MSLFSQQNLEDAVGRLSMCRYFPAEAATRAAIMRELAKMCPNLQALDWLVDTMVTRVGEWKGPVELRGVLCWKYKPVDGIEANCIETSGFMIADGERISLEHHEQLKHGGYVEGDVRQRDPEIGTPGRETLRRMIPAGSNSLQGSLRSKPN